MDVLPTTQSQQLPTPAPYVISLTVSNAIHPPSVPNAPISIPSSPSPIHQHVSHVLLITVLHVLVLIFVKLAPVGYRLIHKGIYVWLVMY